MKKQDKLNEILKDLQMKTRNPYAASKAIREQAMEKIFELFEPDRSGGKKALKKAQKELKAEPVQYDENFVDLWNCGMCRNAHSLCMLHEKLTADGVKPPNREKVPTHTPRENHNE